MYQLGEYIVYENRGVCRLENITSMALPGQPEKKYYEFVPVFEEHGKIFSAVDNERVNIRPMLSKEEATALIDEMPHIGQLFIPDEKQRETAYKEAMRSGDMKQLVSIIKTLYTRNQERLSQGKRTTNTDDRYYKKACENLNGELAVVMGMDKGEVEAYIADKLHRFA